jgi:hypothetical protein
VTNFATFTVSKFSASAGKSAYITSGEAVLVDAGVIIQGFTDNISAAKVMIQNKKVGDQLIFENLGGLAGIYDATTGALTLSGSATAAVYQAALRSVKFSTTSEDLTERTVVFSLGSGLYYDANQHFYEYVSASGISWNTAKTAAENRSLYGRTGYLATLTSGEENAFVAEKVEGLGWIGAKDIHYVDTSSDDSLGDWRWVTGPEGTSDSGIGTKFFTGYVGYTPAAIGYVNWWNGEPNNGGIDNTEYVAHIFGPLDTMPEWATSPTIKAKPGEWNDFPENPGSVVVKGYVVEYGGMPMDMAIGVQTNKVVSVAAYESPSVVNSTRQQPALVIVLVNGQVQNAGIQTNTIEDGRRIVTVALNEEIIDEKIDEAIKNNTGGTGNTIQVPVSETVSQVAKVELTGNIVKKLEANAFDVSIKRDNVEYLIPAEEFTISQVAQNLGILEKDLDDIKVEVTIARLDSSVTTKYEEMAKANGAELVFPPVEFQITAKVTQSDGIISKVEISRFANYVERILEIPASVDPSKITTGIVFHADGTYSHVPTDVFMKDGKWYARVSSLTNSNYSVIWHPVTVESVENHWGKEAVNDMASRLVILEPENFQPNEAITRGDFSEYIIRALGLFKEGTSTLVVANEQGIMKGYPDGTLKSEQLITREEAMTMYQRAMIIARLAGNDDARYQKYADAKLVSCWAEPYAREVLSAHVFNGTSETTISPKSNLTYAESAQAIRNLLVESNLINQ